MPMQPVQIANSGVIPGRYGNNTQIPTFNVDQRGRLTFAANVDIEPILNIRVNDNQNSTLNLNTDIVRFQSGDGITVRFNNEGAIEFSLDTLRINRVIEDLGIGEPISNILIGFDGTILADPSSNRISGASAIFNSIDIASPAIKVITDSTEAGLQIKGPGEGLLNGPHITLVSFSHSNNYTDLVGVNVGDSLGQIRFSTEVGNENQNAPSAVITSILESVGDNVTTFNNSDIRLICLDGGNPSGIYQAKLSRSTGFTAPAITPGSYSDESVRDSSIVNPIPGMIIYLDSRSKFQGYVGGN